MAKNFKLIALGGISVFLLKVGTLTLPLGYTFANFASKRLPSVKFKIKNLEFHYHHWIMGLNGILICALFDFFNPFLLGFLSGVTLEGIANYSDWKVVVRRIQRQSETAFSK